MFKNLFGKGNADKKECVKTADIPHVVGYMYNNVPLKNLPVNAIYVFLEDACTLLGVMLTPGIFKIPVIVYRVSEKNFNFFNYNLELIGGLRFSEDFSTIQTFGKDFQEKTGFVTYKLMNLSFDYSNTEKLLRKKFETVSVFNP